MYCTNCGNKINDGELFCSKCGSKTKQEMTYKLVCRACGGSLNVDSNNIAHCPHCGSKEIIIESDNVAVERIKSTTEKELQRMKWEREDEVSRQLSVTLRKVVIFTVCLYIIIGILLYLVPAP